jgi:NADH-quinone oxidoreductase subunit M
MLIVMLVLFFYSDVDPDPGVVKHTFDITLLSSQSTHLPWLKAENVRLILYIMLYIGFAIKVPVFPFHTWLPDAHVEAPTPISVILAGVLLKMGTYGMLRISYSIFPDVAVNTAYWLAVLGSFNIVYGALVAMAQQDFKKMIAYSSISHMGYVLLGMASFTQQGVNGAVLQMFNHGTITGMLFLIVGVVYDRAHHRNIDGFGGLASHMPRYAGITSLAFFASMGLPGLSGFISEVLVFLGAYRAFPELVYFSATGIIITAAYLLWAFQRVFLGPINEKYKAMGDINFREIFTLAPLGIIVVILGVYPAPALNILRETMNLFVKMAETFPFKGF